MTEMAGEVADGFIVHPFGTERSLRELTIPARRTGRGACAAAPSPTSRSRSRSWPSSADTDEQLAHGRDAMRPRLAFYGSTPAYKVILDVHGWGDLQPELNRLSKTGDWATMSSLITDEMVDAFACRAPPTSIGAIVRETLRRSRRSGSHSTPSAQLDPARATRTLAGIRA